MVSNKEILKKCTEIDVGTLNLFRKCSIMYATCSMCFIFLQSFNPINCYQTSDN
jgi:hypothetical protein